MYIKPFVACIFIITHFPYGVPDNQYIMGSHADKSASIWRLSDGGLVKSLTLPQVGDPEFTIDPEFRVWKWMEWAFFLPR